MCGQADESEQLASPAAVEPVLPDGVLFEDDWTTGASDADEGDGAEEDTVEVEGCLTLLQNQGQEELQAAGRDTRMVSSKILTHWAY